MVRRRRRILRRSSTLANSYASTSGGGMGSIASGSIIHIKKTLFIRRRKAKNFYMFYGQSPYYQPLSAVVTTGSGHANLAIASNVGGSSIASLGLQDLHLGQQNISNWPVASTTGLGRKLNVMVQNFGMSSSITIDLTVRLLSKIG